MDEQEITRQFGVSIDVAREALGIHKRTGRPLPQVILDMASPAPAVPKDPERLGKYVVVERLGDGGQGTVFKVRNPDLGRFEALKILKSNASLYADEARRFRREARLLAALRHPNIVPVFEVGTIDDRPFYTMEYVEGTTVWGLIGEKGRLEPKEALDLALGAGRALATAHAQGVIHRDVKPQNMLLRTDEDGRTVLLADFGLARRGGGGSLTASGMIMGSPSYLPPEQAEGDVLRVGPRSDVYGLGASMYAMLAGFPPYEGEAPLDILRSVVGRDPTPLRRHLAGLDRDVETIVAKAMERDPDRRYASAAEMIEDIEHKLAGEPIRARPATPWRRAVLALKRNRATAATVAGVIVLIAAFAAYAVSQSVLGARREAALQELGALWNRVTVAKLGIHMPYREPADIRRELREAEADVSSFIERNPDLPQGYYVRARSRFYSNDLDAAETDAAASVALDDGFAPGWALLARIKLERYTQGSYGDPTTVSLRKRRLAPLLDEAKAALARAGDGSVARWGLVRTREDEVAERLLPALIRMHVEDDHDGARELLEAAQAAMPSEEYCRWLAALGGADAARWLDEAIRIAPHFAPAYLARGTHEDLTRAIEIDPEYAFAYVNRAQSWRERGRFDDALADAETAVRLDPSNPTARHSLANSLADLGRLEEAVAEATRALDLDPEAPNVYNLRGVTRAQLDDLDGAIADFRAALRTAPDGWADRANVEANLQRALGLKEKRQF